MSTHNIKAFLEYIENIETNSSDIDIDKVIKIHKQYKINLDDLTENQILIILANLNVYKNANIANTANTSKNTNITNITNIINNKLNIKIIEWEFKNLKLSDIIKSEILHNCILSNNLEIVEYLSQTDSYCKQLLNQMHFNIFAQVCYNGYLDMAQFLIDYQTKNIDKNIDIVNNRSLINQPYDYNDILTDVAIKGHLDIFIYMRIEKENEIIENI